MNPFISPFVETGELLSTVSRPDGDRSAAQAGTYFQPLSSNMNGPPQVHHLGLELGSRQVLEFLIHTATSEQLKSAIFVFFFNLNN